MESRTGLSFSTAIFCGSMSTENKTKAGLFFQKKSNLRNLVYFNVGLEYGLDATQDNRIHHPRDGRVKPSYKIITKKCIEKP
jgi:hypothetical protein